MLTVDDVCIDIGKKRIVSDVTLNVEDGEFVGIIGPNGSGKSTLLKSIYRVLKRTSGDIKIMGDD